MLENITDFDTRITACKLTFCMQRTKGTISVVISAADLMEIKKGVKVFLFVWLGFFFFFLQTSTNVSACSTFLSEMVSKVNLIFNQTDHLRLKQMFKRKSTGKEVK